MEEEVNYLEVDVIEEELVVVELELGELMEMGYLDMLVEIVLFRVDIEFQSIFKNYFLNVVCVDF